MAGRAHLVSILATAVVLIAVFELVRRRRLLERYAIIWLAAAIVLLTLAIWEGLLGRVAKLIGIYYPPTALFGIALAAIIFLLLHFSLAVSRLTDQTKILAQRLALLEQQVRERDPAPAAAEEPRDPEPVESARG